MENNFIGNGEQREQAQSHMNFDSMMGQPVAQPNMNDKGKYALKIGKAWKVFAITAATIAIIALVLGLIGIKSGAFLSKPNKVMNAVKNTIESTQLGRYKKIVKILNSKEYTVDFSSEIEKTDIDGRFMKTKKLKAVESDLRIPGVWRGEVWVELDREKLSGGISALDDKIFVYNYKKNNNGELIDILDDIGIEQETVNEMLQSLYSEKESEEYSKDMLNTVKKMVQGLEFESVFKESFTINGKKVACQGYEVVITNDDIENMLDDMETVMEEHMENMDVDDSISKAFDAIRAASDYMEDLEMTFYLHKNKLACVCMEMADEELEIVFPGGDKGMLNMYIEADGSELLEIKGSKKGKEEVTTISVDGDKVIEYTHNLSDGEIELEVDYSSEMKITGILKEERKKVYFEIDEIEADGEKIPVEFSLMVSSGAKVKKHSGEMIDLGTADQSDLEDFVEELYEEYDKDETDLSEQIAIPTEMPTILPTETPIILPTESPTIPPTEAPIIPPTMMPIDYYDEYIFPDSDSRYLKKSELKGFGREECRIARNEIYARHGRRFIDEELQAYFDSCSWYIGTIDAEEFAAVENAALNQYEKANRDLIVEYEKKHGYR